MAKTKIEGGTNVAALFDDVRKAALSPEAIKLAKNLVKSFNSDTLAPASKELAGVIRDGSDMVTAKIVKGTLVVSGVVYPGGVDTDFGPAFGREVATAMQGAFERGPNNKPNGVSAKVKFIDGKQTGRYTFQTDARWDVTLTVPIPADVAKHLPKNLRKG